MTTTTQGTFAVLYQGTLKPGMESLYCKYWRAVATHFKESRGAIESTLHKTSDGKWVAYSRWPDQATRDRSWPSDGSIPKDLPKEVKIAVTGIHDCLEHQDPQILMEIVDDTSFPSGSN